MIVARNPAWNAPDAPVPMPRSFGWPDLRLAFTDIHPNSPIGKVFMHDRDVQPAVLMGYPYADTWKKHRARFKVRSWALDSGAVTAANSGEPIDLAEYTAFAADMKQSDPTLEDVFALDVVGDWRASARNAEWMWKHGVEAIPCWHAGEPEDVLVGLARDYPKIAMGGSWKMRGPARIRLVEQVFARIWPKRIHGFGMSEESLLMKFPFHSVDASSWQLGPMKFRQFKGFGKANLRVPCKTIDLRGEVDHYLALEARARAQWARLIPQKP
jgi:hypothetical protein